MKQGYIPPQQNEPVAQRAPRNYRIQPAIQQPAPTYQQPNQPSHAWAPPAAGMNGYQQAAYAPVKTRRSVLLLISSIMGLIYAIVMIIYFFGVAKQSLAPGSTDFEEMGKQIGGAIAAALVTPHIVIVTIAAIFNILAWYLNKGWAALTAGILYLVGGVIFFIYLPYVLIQAVLAFIGFSKVSDKRKQAQPNYQYQ